jgi:hypothetical protein
MFPTPVFAIAVSAVADLAPRCPAVLGLVADGCGAEVTAKRKWIAARGREASDLGRGRARGSGAQATFQAHGAALASNDRRVLGCAGRACQPRLRRQARCRRARPQQPRNSRTDGALQAVGVRQPPPLGPGSEAGPRRHGRRLRRLGSNPGAGRWQGHDGFRPRLGAAELLGADLLAGWRNRGLPAHGYWVPSPASTSMTQRRSP